MILAPFIAVVLGAVGLYLWLSHRQMQRWAQADQREAEWRAALAKGGRLTVEDPSSLESIGPVGVPDVVGDGVHEVKCPCGNLKIGLLTSYGFYASRALQCPSCGAVVEQVAQRGDS